jgi:fumarate reductase flavoprotein subunit
VKKLFKKSSILLLILMLVFTFVGCQNKEVKGKFNPGTYEGTAEGLGGTITAKVTVTKDEITKIEIDAPKETESIGAGAKEQVIDRVLSSQSLAIDAVSGATVSSNAMIAAITAALEKSGADMNVLKTPADKPKEEAQKDLDVDVVVVGAGGAGMSAAIEVANAGKSVVIIEKMPIVGGNTNRATGGINAAETPYQEAAGIKDTKQTFYDDTMKGGKDLNDPELLRTLVDNAPGAIEWLNNMGAGIERVTLSGGATNPRIHSPKDASPVGPVIVKVLSNKLKEQNVNIMLETKAEKIIEKDGIVTGIQATDKNGNSFTINAKAVILATGGFGANSEMVEQYRPDLKGFSTTNHQGATGDGIVMAQTVGADLTDIGEIQIHPTTDPGTGYLFTEGLRGDGAILVNFEGKRFTDELLTRDKVSAKILEQTNGQAYLIANEEMRIENASLAGYIEKGYATKGETIAELARSLTIDEATLENTMKVYTELAKAGVDKEFGRKHMTKTLEAGPYYAIKVTPGIHHTMGGVKIDTKAHIISTEGTPIKGLYAAGEITGGVHGGNRIGGNAVADIVIFGRISGQTAVEELK